MIPLLVAAAATGVVSRMSASDDNDSARRTIKKANSIIQYTNNHIDICKIMYKQSIKELSAEKTKVLQGNMARFVETFSKIKEVNFKDVEGTFELGEFKKNEVSDIISMVNSVKEVTPNEIASNASGTALAIGAADLATGGAVLGGLGLEIIGGTLVSAVAAPIFVISSLFAASEAAERLEEAKSDLVKAKAYRDEAATQAMVITAVCKRCGLFYQTLVQLDENLFTQAVDTLVEIVESKDTEEYRKKSANGERIYTREELAKISSAASLAKAIKTLIETNIVDENGAIRKESKQVLTTIKKEKSLKIKNKGSGVYGRLLEELEDSKDEKDCTNDSNTYAISGVSVQSKNDNGSAELAEQFEMFSKLGEKKRIKTKKGNKESEIETETQFGLTEAQKEKILNILKENMPCGIVRRICEEYIESHYDYYFDDEDELADMRFGTFLSIYDADYYEDDDEAESVIKGLELQDCGEIYFVHDDTPKKEQKDGFAITERGFYCRYSDKRNLVSYDSLLLAKRVYTTDESMTEICADGRIIVCCKDCTMEDRNEIFNLVADILEKIGSTAKIERRSCEHSNNTISQENYEEIVRNLCHNYRSAYNDSGCKLEEQIIQSLGMDKDNHVYYLSNATTESAFAITDTGIYYTNSAVSTTDAGFNGTSSAINSTLENSAVSIMDTGFISYQDLANVKKISWKNKQMNTIVVEEMLLPIGTKKSKWQKRGLLRLIANIALEMGATVYVEGSEDFTESEEARMARWNKENSEEEESHTPLHIETICTMLEKKEANALAEELKLGEPITAEMLNVVIDSQTPKNERTALMADFRKGALLSWEAEVSWEALTAKHWFLESSFYGESVSEVLEREALKRKHIEEERQRRLEEQKRQEEERARIREEKWRNRKQSVISAASNIRNTVEKQIAEAEKSITQALESSLAKQEEQVFSQPNNEAGIEEQMIPTQTIDKTGMEEKVSSAQHDATYAGENELPESKAGNVSEKTKEHYHQTEIVEKLCMEFKEKYSVKGAAVTAKLMKNLGMNGTETVYFIHDDTLLNTGKNGFAITNAGIYCKALLEKPKFMSYEELAKAKNIEFKTDLETAVFVDGVSITTYCGGTPEVKRGILELVRNISAAYKGDAITSEKEIFAGLQESAAASETDVSAQSQESVTVSETDVSAQSQESVTVSEMNVPASDSEQEEQDNKLQETEWIFCGECGKKLKFGKKFCTKCGAKLDYE